MNSTEHVTATGQIVQLADLEPQERRLVDAARRKYDENPKCSEFAAWWQSQARSLCLPKEAPAYRICQNLEHCLGIAQGDLPRPDLETCVTNLIEELYGPLDRYCRVEGSERKLVLVPTVDSHVFNDEGHIDWVFLIRPVLDRPDRRPASVGILVPFRIPYSRCKRHFWRFLDFSQERGRQRLLGAAIEDRSVDEDSAERMREWQRGLARQIRLHDLCWKAFRGVLQEDFTRAGKHLGGSRTDPCRRALVEEIVRLLNAGNDEDGSWNAPKLWRHFQRRSRTLKDGFRTSPHSEGMFQDPGEKSRLKVTGLNGRSKTITCDTFRSYVAEAKGIVREIG